MSRGRAPTVDELQALQRLRDAIAREVGQPKPDRAQWPVSFKLYGMRRPLIREEPDQAVIDDDGAFW